MLHNAYTKGSLRPAHAPALIALAVAGFTSVTHAEGFLDDTKATLNLRNAYFNRNFTNPDNGQGKAEEWTQ
ncbi:OprD family outer membrane porin, partial [Pseudomonas turukhanskensis]|uniref:OprD family outer membrane porin n=1 Tax=Pseudomonas turukhanskensis TaxID=1806536 RepID=UPI0022F2B72E